MQLYILQKSQKLKIQTKMNLLVKNYNTKNLSHNIGSTQLESHLR
jgi:hypothetical protein